MQATSFSTTTHPIYQDVSVEVSTATETSTHSDHPKALKKIAKYVSKHSQGIVNAEETMNKISEILLKNGCISSQTHEIQEDHKRHRTTLNIEKFSKKLQEHINELNVFDINRQGDIYERLNHRNAYIYSSLNTLIKHYARNLLTKSVLAKLEFANWHTRSIGIQLYNLKSISSLIEDVKLFQTKIHDYRTETLPKEKAEKKFAILETGRKFMEEGEYAISYNYLFDRVEKIFIDNNNLIKKLNEEIETPFTLELDAYDKDTRDKVQEIYLEAHVTIKKHKEMLISELTENLTDLQDAMNALHEELTYSRIVIVDRKGEPPASKTLTQLWSQPKYFKAPAFSISS